ncbi:MAG: LemA family protein [Shewanella sp.]
MDTLFLGLALVVIVSYLWYVSLVKKYRAALEALAAIEASLTKRLESLAALLALVPGLASSTAFLSASSLSTLSLYTQSLSTASLSTASLAPAPLLPKGGAAHLATLDAQGEPLMALIAKIYALATERAQAWQPLSGKTKVEAAQISAYLAVAEQINRRVANLLTMLNQLDSVNAPQDALQLEGGRLHETETQMAAVCRYYNGAVLELNGAVEIFPGSIIAALAGIKGLPQYTEA